jgi:hypothetical protein
MSVCFFRSLLANHVGHELGQLGQVNLGKQLQFWLGPIWMAQNWALISWSPKNKARDNLATLSRLQGVRATVVLPFSKDRVTQNIPHYLIEIFH